MPRRRGQAQGGRVMMHMELFGQDSQDQQDQKKEKKATRGEPSD
jgi:hypothetical protein